MNNSTPKTTPTITADNLPLQVREHLMRGQHESAIDALVNQHGLDKNQAEQTIHAYREALRERKIALDIQIMNAQNAREGEDRTRQIIIWGGRLLVIIFALIVLQLITTI